ncbi:acyl-CoA dehydrogenase family protein [Streptomyces sp. NPDC096132]|uniref:acyl-CoA dehydrogenase family protein n=1 Tax=Streptomyces sp. NPDC096132 TaxID=3366075 RepID=UPI0037F5F15E
MRFLLDPEQRAFADSLDALLTAADTPRVVREWSRGEHTSGRALWRRVAEAGVFALAVPEAYEGLGPRPVDLAVAFVELGRHAVPGPLVETVTAAALIREPGPAKRLLPALAAGESVATVAYEGAYALDGDMADVRLSLTPEGLRLAPGPDDPPLAPGSDDPRLTSGPDSPRLTSGHAGPPLAPDPDSPSRAPRPDGRPLACDHDGVRISLDPARRLTRLRPGGELLAGGPPAREALLLARLVTAAQALGVGLALLDRTVAYVRQRTQFGVPVGSFQAVKHRLADARIALEFARPLVLGAAVTMTAADVAAAKVSACEAAYATARTALQLHGAIGYTAEYDLSLWLTKARALRTAWGTPQECRADVLAAHI